MVRVREGEKERLQAFEGVCIARRGGGMDETFTVRKISAGVGVERIFPLHSAGDRRGRPRAQGPRATGQVVLPATACGQGRAHPPKARRGRARRRVPRSVGATLDVTRRRRPTLEREAALWREGRRLVAGIDEVGRGPLAGPVVAAAVVFPPGTKPLRGLDDSKRLTAAARAEIAVTIRERAFAVGVGAASVHEIDRLNIRRASILAMRRALDRLRCTPAYVLVDGLPCPELGVPHTAIIDGDARCQSIAAASVIAKTVRDRLMQLLALRHPGYLWERNKGYSTTAHLAALDAHGLTAHHRLSFQPVTQLILL